MDADLIVSPEFEAPSGNVSQVLPMPPAADPRVTRWLLVGAQILVLLAYGMGIGFLVKTTAGTLVLFSLVAPALVAIAVLTLVGVAVWQFRKRHGVSGFKIYDRGQIIFRQGEPSDCAYFIQSGEVEVIRDENGSESVVATLSEGEYFGEKALISSAPRSATIRAATQTRVGVIHKRRFLTMVIVLPASVEDVVRVDRRSKRTRKFAS
jgi:hypothetical protein